MKRTCPKIHHSLFVDERNARALKPTLERLSEVSGQKNILDKSCIQFGATTRDLTKC